MPLLTSTGPAEPSEYLPGPAVDVEPVEPEPTESVEDEWGRLDDSPLSDDDPVFETVRQLLRKFGGVIFTGPPGTSKSWYARRIGWNLADHDERRIVFLQFHPSYQYEDFVQGIAPREDGLGFEPVAKPFLQMCGAAEEDREHTYVIVIDELSRADPGRVFGEALTYVERSKRGLAFQLALSQEAVRVPENLVVLATMNPLDRGVDEVDAAFERRFAKIAMEPDAEIVERFLDEQGITDPRRQHLLTFFHKANGRARQNPLAAIGHTFFMEVEDETSLEQLWEHQLRFLFEKAYRLDRESFEEVKVDWEKIYRD
jgi:5-methylcytosine-specific restriction protein B